MVALVTPRIGYIAQQALLVVTMVVRAMANSNKDIVAGEFN